MSVPHISGRRITGISSGGQIFFSGPNTNITASPEICRISRPLIVKFWPDILRVNGQANGMSLAVRSSVSEMSLTIQPSTAVHWHFLGKKACLDVMIQIFRRHSETEVKVFNFFGNVCIDCGKVVGELKASICTVPAKTAKSKSAESSCELQGRFDCEEFAGWYYDDKKASSGHFRTIKGHLRHCKHCQQSVPLPEFRDKALDGQRKIISDMLRRYQKH